MIANAARFCSALSGWRRRGALTLLGAVTVLGLPPFDIWPIAFLTLPLFLWVFEGVRTKKAAFGTGWWFAFGYFLAGLYWISNALVVFSPDFWWMVPFALVGLPVVMAVYYGLATLLVDRILPASELLEGTARRLARILLLTAAFVGADLLRGTLFTGFPWNVFGYLWSGSAGLSQGASWLGVYGLGVPVLLSGFLPALLANGRTGRFALVAAVAIPLVFALAGTLRLSDAPDMAIQQADANLPGLRLVQPNIPQQEKWKRDLRVRNFEQHLNASRDGRPDWVKTVIWPETAAAFAIDQAADFRLSAGAWAVPEGGLLITGAPRLLDDPKRLYNAAVALDGIGTMVATYEKSHLVPFGEYVPFSQYLPFGKVAAGAIDYSPGPGPQTLSLPGLPPVGPMICYEVIFPGAVIDSDNRPDWMLNLTNDAWYGHTTGPYQHLQHSRMRAIEEGLPLVRAASTGISAAFDAYGREIGRIGLGESGTLDLHLPPPMDSTLFARLGNLLAVGLVILVAGVAFILRKR